MTRKVKPLRCFPPIIDKNSRVLILGTMPSPESFRRSQYYAHPYNLFWSIIGQFVGVPVWKDWQHKKRALLKNRMALWDVLATCHRPGSSDSLIRGEFPNDIRELLKKHPNIRAIFLNGKTAERLFRKYFPDLKYPGGGLPSTSPAHASLSRKEKIGRWGVIRRYLN